MPPDMSLVKDEMPLFEDYLNSAFPCDDLFFNDKPQDLVGSPLLRTFSEDRHALSSPSSSHSCSSKDESVNEADSDVSLAIKISNNSSDATLHKKPKDAEECIPIPGKEDVLTDPTSPDKLDLEDAQRVGETGLSATLHYQLNLHGIPSKSRVETQIKLGIQVVRVIDEGSSLRETEIGDRFQWLKLPSWAMAKEKLKIQNRRDAPATIDPNRIIFLDARVVKSTEPLEDVTICSGCVIRERKRAQRKKDPPKRSPQPETGEGAPAVEPPELVPLPDENKKILVFNCPELLEISNGEVVIPTRVTCYCRHHKEKDGFRIIITLRDALNNILASTSSELVLITDDHKTTGKVQRVRDQITSSVKGQPYHILPSSTARLASQNDIQVDTISALHKPLSRRSSISSTTTSAKKRKAEYNGPQTTQSNHMNSKMQKLPDSLSMTNISRQNHNGMLPASEVSSRMPSPTTSLRQVQRSPSQDSLFNFMSTRSDHHVTGTHVHSPMHSASIANSISSPDNCFFDTSMDELMHERNTSMSPRTRTWDYIMDNAASTQSSSVDRQNSGIIMPPTAAQQQIPASPAVSRMIPSEGPLQGGTEVTILGNGFYPGMTAMFGEAAAVPTHCWSSTTLVCVLPPATNAGPVPVTFKEHPYSAGSKMFTYMDETDRALYELALQVIGLKTTGRLETARDVAMRICSSKLPSESVDTNLTSMPIQRLRAALGMSEESSDTQELVRRCLIYLDEIDNDKPLRLSQRSKSGHTLMHLAIMKNYYHLASDLLDRGCNINVRSRTSLTALHTVALYGDVDLCRLLVLRGNPNMSLCTSDGKTAYDIAAVHDDEDLLEMLDPWRRADHLQVPLSVRSTRSNSQTSLYNDTESLSGSSSAVSSEAAYDSHSSSSESTRRRSISSRASGTRTQPTSRAHSPTGLGAGRDSRNIERRRSRSVNNLMLSGLSKDELQALAEKSKIAIPEQEVPNQVDAQTVVENLIQIQQTWMAFLSQTSPVWLQKTLANANASLPEVLKTTPSLVQHMQLSSSPISTFHAMLPHLPQIRPLSRTTSTNAPHDGQIKPTNATTTDPGWLQNLVSSLGAPPSYAEAISSRTASSSSSSSMSTAQPPSAAETQTAGSTPESNTHRQAALDTHAPGWFERSISIPFRSQGRVAEMTPEQQRAQVRRFQKPVDKMMFFFWLPCLLFFIAISIGKACVDKILEFVY